MKSLLLAALLACASAPLLAHDGVHHDPNLPAGAKAQIHETAAAIAKYKDFAVAEREGWKKFGGDAPLMGEHWFLPVEKGGRDYVHGDRIDWARPSNLMYTDIGGKPVLTGVTFNVRLNHGEPVPEGFAGQADRWHVHDFQKALAAALQDRPMLRWLANGWINDNFTKKGDTRGRVAMVHAWVTLANPDGIFADSNRTLPYLKLGLPLSMAQGASLNAAKGLHLATKSGCVDNIDGALWIANAGGKTKKALHSACAAAADHVRMGLKAGDKASVNSMAEHGWAMFDAAWSRVLTPQQQARIAAMNEHGDRMHGEGRHDEHGGKH